MTCQWLSDQSLFYPCLCYQQIADLGSLPLSSTHNDILRKQQRSAFKILQIASWAWAEEQLRIKFSLPSSCYFSVSNPILQSVVIIHADMNCSEQLLYRSRVRFILWRCWIVAEQRNHAALSWCDWDGFYAPDVYHWSWDDCDWSWEHCGHWRHCGHETRVLWPGIFTS